MAETLLRVRKVWGWISGPAKSLKSDTVSQTARPAATCLWSSVVQTLRRFSQVRIAVRLQS